MFITIKTVHMIFSKDFLLASNSSSRHRLLKSAGLKFQTIKPRCNEELIKEKLLNLEINIKNLPKYLAKEKALSVSKKTNKLVVGSDTIIIFQNTLISKANNFKEAKKKLQKLSGKKHKIISAVSAAPGCEDVDTGLGKVELLRAGIEALGGLWDDECASEGGTITATALSRFAICIDPRLNEMREIWALLGKEGYPGVDHHAFTSTLYGHYFDREMEGDTEISIQQIALPSIRG